MESNKNPLILRVGLKYLKCAYASGACYNFTSQRDRDRWIY